MPRVMCLLPKVVDCFLEAMNIKTIRKYSIENRTFDEILVGESASLKRTLSKEDIELFAIMSGDVNPAHVDEEYARSDIFHKIIAHGMWGAALISTLLGTKLPGPGTIYLEQTLRFHHPVVVGDTVTVTITAREKDVERHHVTFDCACTNQRGEVVISGCAEVLAPTEKVKRPARNILVVPDLEAGNMLAKQLEYLADAQSTGIVVGARVPIVLTSRADSPLAHMASCALALLLVRSKQQVKRREQA